MVAHQAAVDPVAALLAPAAVLFHEDDCMGEALENSPLVFRDADVLDAGDMPGLAALDDVSVDRMTALLIRITVRAVAPVHSVAASDRVDFPGFLIREVLVPRHAVAPADGFRVEVVAALVRVAVGPKVEDVGETSLLDPAGQCHRVFLSPPEEEDRENQTLNSEEGDRLCAARNGPVTDREKRANASGNSHDPC